MVRYSYTHLDEFFVLSQWQEDVKGPFGLTPPPGDWESFKAKIKALNDVCPPGESVKVIYAARHGQAEHNVIADKYGEMGQMQHPILDPDLTPLGRSQAYQTRLALERECKRGMPLPERWFVSPLKRAGETCGIEWGWLFADDYTSDGLKEWKGGKGHGVDATVIENIREHLHVHQCDARYPLSALKAQFTSFTYPEGMSDEDDVWKPIVVRGRETEEELVARRGEGIREVLERSQGDTYISLTSHSGALRGIYKSLNVIPRKVIVGEMNVLVIRVKEVQE
ncbi:hypothetical protein I302_104189 [Kwoniella bestiolae CBS 10118]|uniref:Phosphoglycerate mutase n=1 Tax=Kwoniella bestiolae CBS 10118 TaxID=1296100 RepID=A0A1B9GAK2_9TREE|nr:hypothetical protein I302_02897 [Kwoniella bestiolae CBS 10118]OCF28046.1 hypothetical protein I302_02897 [Kwoniella bestiolae CBS 10118]